MVTKDITILYSFYLLMKEPLKKIGVCFKVLGKWTDLLMLCYGIVLSQATTILEIGAHNPIDGDGSAHHKLVAQHGEHSQDWNL